MGVQVRIVLYAPDESTAVTVARSAYARIAALEDLMSDYRPTSELMRLSSKAGGPPVQVTPELYLVIEKSLEIARQSCGAFDITAGPVIRLWREARRSGKLPDPVALKQARKLVGWQKVKLYPKTRSIRLTTPGMQLDLGGIAKGYAADEMMKVLRANGIHSALIELGGDFLVSDAPPGTNGWQMVVENADEAHRHITVSNVAISSSGDTMQYVDIDGVRYSHIVNPRTGYGLTTRTAATIIGKEAMTTDRLSTTLTILGEKNGQKLIRKYYPGYSAYIRSAAENK